MGLALMRRKLAAAPLRYTVLSRQTVIERRLLSLITTLRLLKPGPRRPDRRPAREPLRTAHALQPSAWERIRAAASTRRNRNGRGAAWFQDRPNRGAGLKKREPPATACRSLPLDGPEGASHVAIVAKGATGLSVETRIFGPALSAPCRQAGRRKEWRYFQIRSTRLSSFQQALDAFRDEYLARRGPERRRRLSAAQRVPQGRRLHHHYRAAGREEADLDVQVKGRTLSFSGEKSVGFPEKAARASPGAARRPVRPGGDHAGRDQPGRRQGRISRRHPCLFLPQAESDKPKSIKVG